MGIINTGSNKRMDAFSSDVYSRLQNTSDWYYRIVLSGNIEELAVGFAPIDIAERLESSSVSSINKYMFGQPYEGIRPIVASGWETLYRLPTWPDLEEQHHICGFVVDSDLRAVVEDQFGEVVHEITLQAPKQNRLVHANDNQVIYELGEYNGVKVESVSPGVDNIGIFNARSFESGTFTYGFELDDEIDVDRIQVPLQDLTTHHLTLGVFYDGCSSDSFDSYRWTVKPPKAVFALTQFAA